MAVFYNAPSVARLVRHMHLTDEQALTVRGLLHGEINPDDEQRFPKTVAWKKQCYNPPKRLDLLLEALNEATEGHGTEPINIEQAWVDRYWMDCCAVYVNVGEAYAPTIVYDTDRDRFDLLGWADMVERLERRHRVRHDH